MPLANCRCAGGKRREPEEKASETQGDRQARVSLRHRPRPPSSQLRPLTPLSSLARSAAVYPHKPAVIHGDRFFTYAEFAARCRRLASALARRGMRPGDTVAIMAPNVPAMLEAHFGVPMAGAVLNALNYRLDAHTIAFLLEHSEAKVLITNRDFAGMIEAALGQSQQRLVVIDIDDPLYDGEGRRLGETDYEALLAEGDPEFELPADEWQAIGLLSNRGPPAIPRAWSTIIAVC